MSETARRLLLEEIRIAVREAVADALNTSVETVDVKGAAELYKTTVRAIYERRRRGRMPKRVPGTRRLLWRRADLLKGV